MQSTLVVRAKSIFAFAEECEIRTHHSNSAFTSLGLPLQVCDAYQDLLEFEGQDRDELLLLLKDRHARYLQAGLGQLPSGRVEIKTKSERAAAAAIAAAQQLVWHLHLVNCRAVQVETSYLVLF